MTENEVNSTLKQIISEVIFKGMYSIDTIEHVNYVEDLSMDSLLYISLVVEIEKNFNIVIPDIHLSLENFQTFNDIKKVVVKLLKLGDDNG